MEEIRLFAQQARESKRRVVLATGVFDALHDEHQKFLAKAKESGDVLLVGIETDKRVKRLKGVERPLNDQNKRLQQLNALPVVDKAFLLPELFSNEEDHLALLTTIQPDVLAVSSHTPFLNQKKKLIQQVGGELKIVHQHNPQVSTTKALAHADHKK